MSSWLVGLGMFCLGMCYAAFLALFLFNNQHIPWVKNAAEGVPQWENFSKALSDERMRHALETLKWMWAVLATLCFSAYFMLHS
jgi:hypothetical protein